jgi:hypothetical protein
MSVRGIRIITNSLNPHNQRQHHAFRSSFCIYSTSEEHNEVHALVTTQILGFNAVLKQVPGTAELQALTSHDLIRMRTLRQ